MAFIWLLWGRAQNRLWESMQAGWIFPKRKKMRKGKMIAQGPWGWNNVYFAPKDRQGTSNNPFHICVTGKKDEQVLLKTVIAFRKQDVTKEFKALCLQANVNPERYLLFIGATGFTWTLEKLSSDIFLSMKTIKPGIRFKILVLYICEKEGLPNIFSLNESWDSCSSSWARKGYENDIAKVKKAITIKIEELCNESSGKAVLNGK